MRFVRMISQWNNNRLSAQAMWIKKRLPTRNRLTMAIALTGSVIVAGCSGFLPGKGSVVKDKPINSEPSNMVHLGRPHTTRPDYQVTEPDFCNGGRAVWPQPMRPSSTHPGRNGELTDQEMKLARIAWKYFENNYQPETGLVNAVNNYPSTTMWDTASYMAGMVAARELKIIPKEEFDLRMMKILQTFQKLDLFRRELPNKAYHTKTGQKVNYANKPGEIGFSALDLGRLLIWLKIIKERYPEHSNAIDNAILRWRFCNVVDARGLMFGALVNGNNETQYVQEGRLGYEEYAARGFQLWGFNTDLSSQLEPYETMPIGGIDVKYDARDPRVLHAHNYVVMESFTLEGIEFNWDHANDRDADNMRHTDPVAKGLAESVFAAQVGRFCNTGILTARTEHQLDKKPYFVYDTVYSDGYAWNTITEKGEYVPQFAAIALKGAFTMWSLFNNEYTDLLYDTVSTLYDPKKGFYEGRYENGSGVIKTFTANNNGIILESLLHKVQGKLLRFGDRTSKWDQVLSDQLKGRQACLPHQKCRGMGYGGGTSCGGIDYQNVEGVESSGGLLKKLMKKAGG